MAAKKKKKEKKESKGKKEKSYEEIRREAIKAAMKYGGPAGAGAAAAGSALGESIGAAIGPGSGRPRRSAVDDPSHFPYEPEYQGGEDPPGGTITPPEGMTELQQERWEQGVAGEPPSSVVGEPLDSRIRSAQDGGASPVDLWRWRAAQTPPGQERATAPEDAPLPEDVEDLTEAQAADLPRVQMPGQFAARRDEVEVLSSPEGGETPREALSSWRDRAAAAGARGQEINLAFKEGWAEEQAFAEKYGVNAEAVVALPKEFVQVNPEMLAAAEKIVSGNQANRDAEWEMLRQERDVDPKSRAEDLEGAFEEELGGIPVHRKTE